MAGWKGRWAPLAGFSLAYRVGEMEKGNTLLNAGVLGKAIRCSGRNEDAKKLSVLYIVISRTIYYIYLHFCSL